MPGIDREIRTLFSGELRASKPDEPPRITGYAAMFNKFSKPLRTERRTWRERIAPGAFTRSLSGSEDIFALVEHSPNHKLARRSNGSLRLSQDEVGLAVEITPPDTSVGRDALAEIRSGLISGWSFAFNAKPSDQSWYRSEEDGWMREIRGLDLFEVTLTAMPAYPDSTVLDLRSCAAAEQYLEDWELECQKKSQEDALQEAKSRERALFLMRTS